MGNRGFPIGRTSHALDERRAEVQGFEKHGGLGKQAKGAKKYIYGEQESANGIHEA